MGDPQFFVTIMFCLLILIVAESLGEMIEAKPGGVFFGGLKFALCSYLIYHIDLLTKILEITQ